MMLDNTLYWIKFQLANNTPQVSSIDLAEIMKMSLIVLESDIQKKNIKLDTSNFAEEHISIDTDKNMLIVIIRNIISNAIKYCPEESGKINIQLGEITSKDIKLMIEDNGEGMSEIQLQKLFAANNFSKSGTSGETGFGLGLSLVKTFSDRLNIRLKVESQPRIGTKFILTIPREVNF